MQAVILAGGLGTRLGQLTEAIPKALVPIAGRPFIEYQIDLFRHSGLTDLIVCVGHLGHLIEEHLGDGHRFGVSIRYGYERDGLLGTAGAIKNIEALLADAFLVQYGDSYLLVDYADVMRYFEQHNALGLMVVYKNDDRWDRSNVVIDADYVRAYDKTNKLPGMDYIDFGVSAFRRETFIDLPLGESTDLSVVHQSLIGQGRLIAYETHERFYEIGSIAGLREFETFLRQGFIRHPGPAARLS